MSSKTGGPSSDDSGSILTAVSVGLPLLMMAMAFLVIFLRGRQTERMGRSLLEIGITGSSRNLLNQSDPRLAETTSSQPQLALPTTGRNVAPPLERNTEPLVDPARKSSYPDYPPPPLDDGPSALEEARSNNNSITFNPNNRLTGSIGLVPSASISTISSGLANGATINVGATTLETAVTDTMRESIAKNGMKAWKFSPISGDPINYSVKVNVTENMVEFKCKKNGCISTLSNIPLLPPGIISTSSSISMLYFEVKIESLGSATIPAEEVTFSIGVTRPKIAVDRLPGNHSDSVGIQSNDLNIYVNGQPAPLNYEKTFGQVGDVIGCGWQDGMIYFTKNGNNMGPASLEFGGDIQDIVLYGKVGSLGPCKFSYNFGSKPFAYIPYTEDNVLFH